MKNILIATAVISLMGSCKFINDKKADAVTSLTEKVIETTTGQKVDAPDVRNADKNRVDIDLTVDGAPIAANFKDAKGTITASPDVIAITVTAEGTHQQQSLIIGFSGKQLAAHKPLQGAVPEVEGKPTFSLVWSDIADNSMTTQMCAQAEGEITRLQEDLVEIRVTGQMGAAGSTDGGKPLSGTITLHYPFFTGMGIAKKDLVY